MIDPISISSHRQSNSSEVDLTRVRKKASSERQTSSADPRLNLEQPKAQDTVQVNLSLRGDLQSLQNSVKTLFSEVKSQLEEYFKITDQDAEEAAKAYLPPEDATGNELLEFFSPKNTAERIVNFATGFFSQFSSNHQDETDQEKIDEFTNLISNAVTEGFEQAKIILGDLAGFEEDSNNIEETYQLVLQGIDEFRVEFLKRANIEPIDPAAQPDPIEEITEQIATPPNQKSDQNQQEAQNPDADINPLG